MEKWILRKIKNYVSNVALDFTNRWGECRKIMERSAENDEGLLKYGMLGVMTAIMMFYAVIGNVFDIVMFLLASCGCLFVFMLWLYFLIMHPTWTVLLTSIVIIPFLFGIIYCERRRNDKIN